MLWALWALALPMAELEGTVRSIRNRNTVIKYGTPNCWDDAKRVTKGNQNERTNASTIERN
jgi:hypothetical protein